MKGKSTNPTALSQFKAVVREAGTDDAAGDLRLALGGVEVVVETGAGEGDFPAAVFTATSPGLLPAELDISELADLLPDLGAADEDAAPIDLAELLEATFGSSESVPVRPPAAHDGLGLPADGAGPSGAAADLAAPHVFSVLFDEGSENGP